ncbi:hypothetical protein JW968_06550 [Candidatus Woesearchaeota archaeon]|nr:hypothetical protein [Candidatus Woesearchaeota archaeon]
MKIRKMYEFMEKQPLEAVRVLNRGSYHTGEEWQEKSIYAYMGEKKIPS